MKFILFSLLFVSAAAYACPDLSGSYRFSDETWNGLIRVEQKGCASVTVTRERLGRREVLQLKTDGQPYVGYADASEPANRFASVYQKATWEKDQLVIRQYAGASENCDGRYAFNSSECHVTEYVLHRDAQTLDARWMQTGLWWKEGGRHIIQVYALCEEADSNSRRIARRD